MRYREPINTLYNKDIKAVDFEMLEKINLPNDLLAKLINIDKLTLIAYNNWYLYNGDYYYFKKMNMIYWFMNELLGEYIAKYMKLPTIEYDIAVYKNEIKGLISKNFRKNYIKYHSCDDLSAKEKIRIEERLKNKSDLSDFRKQLVDYTLLSFYMCLSDRDINVLYYKFFRMYFAPIFDYESSFFDSTRDYIDDPLFYNKITIEDVQSLILLDDYFKCSVDKIMEFDMKKALNTIEEERNMNIPDWLLKHYQDYDEQRKLFLTDNLHL